MWQFCLPVVLGVAVYGVKVALGQLGSPERVGAVLLTAVAAVARMAAEVEGVAPGPEGAPALLPFASLGAPSRFQCIPPSPLPNSVGVFLLPSGGAMPFVDDPHFSRVSPRNCRRETQFGGRLPVACNFTFQKEGGGLVM